MKFHLPIALRAALLTCFAQISPVFTLATVTATIICSTAHIQASEMSSSAAAITLSEESSKSLVWDATNPIWTVDGDGWKEDLTFSEGDNVSFEAAIEAEEITEITVVGDIIAGDMTLADEAKYNYIGEDSITLGGSLKLGANASASFANLDLSAATGVALGKGASLTIANAELIINGKYSSEGTLSISGDLSFNESTDKGGNVTANNVTLAGKNNTFAIMLVTGTVSNGTGTLTLAGGSSIGTLIGGGLSAKGDVSITTIDGELVSLSNSTGTLTLSSDLSVAGSFTNTGSINLKLEEGVATANLILEKSTSKGGNVHANDISLAGSNNSFDAMIAEGSVTNGTGTLSLGDGSSIGTLKGGSLSAKGDVSIGTLEDDLGSLSNDKGILTLGSDLTIKGSFTNKGTINVNVVDGVATGNIVLDKSSSYGGNVHVNDLTLAATGYNTFDKVIVEGTLTTGTGRLTIKDGSVINTLTGGGSLTVDGNVNITNVDENLVNLIINNNGTLTLGDKDLVVTGTYSNGGSLSTQGSVSFAVGTTKGGILSAVGSVTLAGADNTFTSINTDAALTNGSATLSLSANSSAASIQGGALSLSAGVNLELEDAEATSELIRITGTGSVSVAGALSLQGQNASSMNSLSVAGDAGLTLAHSLTVTDALSVSKITVTSLSQAHNAFIRAKSLDASAGNLTIDISNDAFDKLALSNNQVFTFIDLETEFSGDMSFANNERVIRDGDKSYTLVYDRTTNNITIKFAISGNSWSGSGDWSADAAGWSETEAPNANIEAMFTGDGINIVNVDAGDAGYLQASEIRIDIAASSSKGFYKFTGDGLKTAELIVASGELIIENTVNVSNKNASGQTVIGSGAALATTLTVSDKGKLTTESLIVNADDTFTNEGTTIVSGALEAVELSIINKGTLSLGADSTIGAINAISSEVDDANANTSIVNIQGDRINIGSINYTDVLNIGGISDTEKNPTIVNVDSLESVSNLNLLAANSILNISTDASIVNVSGKGEIHVEGTLTLTGVADMSGSITAQELVLMGRGNVIGTLSAGELTLSGTLESGKEAALTVSKVTNYNGSSSRLTLGITDISTLGAGGTYNLIADGGGKGLVASMFNLDVHRDEIQQLAKDGLNVELVSVDGNIVLEVVKVDERTWQTGSNKSDGLDIKTEGEGVYSSFDYVDHVSITGNDTIDLIKDSITSAANKDLGLTLKNINGLSTSETLTLKGDGQFVRAESFDDSEVADKGDLLSFINNENTKAVHDTIVIDKLTVQVGSSNDSSLEIGSIELKNGALYVLDGTEAIYDADNEEKAYIGDLTVGSLKGDVDSVIGGEITINSVFGSYSGNYDNAIINISGSDTKYYDKDGQLQQSFNLKGLVEVDDAEDGEDGVEGTEAIKPHNGVNDVTFTGDSGYAELVYQTGSRITKIESTGANLTITAGEGATGGLTLNAASSMLGGSLNLGLASGDIIGNTLNPDEMTAIITGESLSLDGTTINLTQSDTSTTLDIFALDGKDTGLTLAYISDDLTIINDAVTINLEGFVLSKYFKNAELQNGKIIADLNTSFYSSESMTENGAIGLLMMDKILIAYNPQYKEPIDLPEPDVEPELDSDVKLDADPDEAPDVEPDVAPAVQSDLVSVLNGLDAYRMAGNLAAADSLGAAVAGASTTALGSAMSSDLERQMQNVRNRAMSSGLYTAANKTGNTGYNAWISAESGNTELEAAGTAAGHSLSSIGGSFGLDVAVNKGLSMGLSLSAMYGDLDAEGTADSASGDFNTLYLAGFARINSGNWTNSFVVSAGTADATLKRTINYGAGSFKTKGETEGFGFGLLYELGYTIILSDDARSSWQPVFNVAIMQSSMDGYTETNSDAALTVGEQKLNYATFGAGARYETIGAGNIFNRTTIFNMRAMLKVDVGDSASEAEVSLGKDGTKYSVMGNEAGKSGLELGAGFSIPNSSGDGSIFADLSIDMRSDKSAVNGSIGYRFSY